MRSLPFVVFFIIINYVVSAQNSDNLQPIEFPNSINAFIGISPDKELLIGSMGGWIMFDGHTTEIYNKNNNPELIDHNIQSHFYTATDGKIWFSSYQSLVSFDPETKDVCVKQLSKVDKILDSDYYVFHLENDTLYGSIAKEFFFYDIRSGIINFTGLKFDNNWTKFYRYNDQIHLINYFQKGTTTHIALTSDFALISRNVLPFRTDEVVQEGESCKLATNRGVINYDLENQHYKSEFPLLEDNVIISIAKLDAFHWVCSDNQGKLYNIKNNVVTLLDNVVPGNPIIHHIWNIGDNIILSSYDSGVFIFSNELIEFKRTLFPFSYSPSCIIPLRDHLFVASASYCPTMLNEAKNNFTRINSSECTVIAEGFKIADGAIITTFEERSKVLILNNEAKLSELKLPGKINDIYIAQYFPDIDKVSLATYSGNIYLGKILKNQFHLEESLKWDDSGRGVGYVICNDKLLIASVNDQYGILYVKKSGKYQFEKKLPLPGYINMHQFDSIRNCVWIASQYGLKKFNLANNLIETEPCIFQNGEIKGLLMDELNRLWLSSANGLYLYIPEECRSKKYGIQEGLPDQNFSSKIATSLNKGIFLFGGNFGWIEFDPEELEISVEAPRIKINKIVLNDNIEIDNSQSSPITLNHKINVVSFQFAAVSLLNGFANNVKYRLFPEEKEFIDLKSATGFARYSHLEPGNYQFQIMAADASGIWMKDPYLLDIIVFPPWWETWWFRLIAIISLVILIGYFSRLYYKRQIEKKDLLLREQKLIIEKQEAVQNERTRIAAEMHDDLGSGLTTIKYLSDKAMRNVTDPQEIVNIQQISEESNELVRNMSEIIWAMNARFDTLENLIIYIRRFAYEFLDQHQIAFELKIPDDIPDLKISGEKRRNIFLVVKEALHNVVKHSGSPTATVSVTFDSDLKITINDQGAGEEDNLNESNGNGLYNMKQRMKKIGGICTFKNGSGWTVMLSLPLEALQN